MLQKREAEEETQKWGQKGTIEEHRKETMAKEKGNKVTTAPFTAGRRQLQKG